MNNNNINNNDIVKAQDIEENIIIIPYNHIDPFSITMNLTNQCNLRCKYCFVDWESKFMTLDIAKEAIAFAHRNLIKHREFYRDIPLDLRAEIVFFGGEPMLMYDSIIKPLLEYVEKNYPIEDFWFSMTTNGTLLYKDRCEFLAKHNVKILLSCDGYKILQDKNRPVADGSSSFDLLEKNLYHILTYFPGTCLRATIAPEDADQLFNLYKWFEDIGVQSCAVMPEFYTGEWTEEAIKKLEDQTDLIYAYRIWQFENNITPMFWKDVDFAYHFIFDHDYEIITQDYFRHPQDKEYSTGDHCGFNLNFVIVDYQGNLYPCQELATSKELHEHYIIGNLKDDININKIKELQKEIREIEKSHLCQKASSCKYQGWCLSNKCASQIIKMQTVDNVQCRYHQKSLQWCLFCLRYLKENEMYIYYLENLYENFKLLNNLKFQEVE